MSILYHTCQAEQIVRPAGIEPAPDAWEAPVLPLNYDRILLKPILKE